MAQPTIWECRWVKTGGKPLREAEIRAFEGRHGIKLPREYREFLLLRNGAYPHEPCGIITRTRPPREYPLQNVMPLIKGTYRNSTVEHYVSQRGLLLTTIPATAIPVAFGTGCVIYMHVSGTRKGEIWAFDDELMESKPTLSQARKRLAASFSEFIDKLQPIP